MPLFLGLYSTNYNIEIFNRKHFCSNFVTEKMENNMRNFSNSREYRRIIFNRFLYTYKTIKMYLKYIQDNI